MIGQFDDRLVENTSACDIAFGDGALAETAADHDPVLGHRDPFPLERHSLQISSVGVHRQPDRRARPNASTDDKSPSSSTKQHTSQLTL